MPFFYLSQVLSEPIYGRAGARVGRVKDLVARLEAHQTSGDVTLEAYPPISGLVAQVAGRDIFVVWNQVQSLDPKGIRLNSLTLNLRPFKRREGEVLLRRDVLDKQLIDIDGKRVIRANDIQLLGSDDKVLVTAVDVSVEAILRRLSFGLLFSSEKPAVASPPEQSSSVKRRLQPAKLINWADIEPLAADESDVRLRLSHDRLALLHP
ncbi:MAG: hypothetical protein ACRDFS_03820, partial [Chloroflexota bacterium]